MAHSLKSVKGLYRDCIGDIKGDIGSLDNGLHGMMVEYCNATSEAVCSRATCFRILQLLRQCLMYVKSLQSRIGDIRAQQFRDCIAAHFLERTLYGSLNDPQILCLYMPCMKTA